MDQRFFDLARSLSGFASGNTVGDQFSNVNNIMAQQQATAQQKAALDQQQTAAKEEENRTRAYLMRVNPGLAQQLQGLSGEPLKQALNFAMQQQFEAQKPKQPDFMSVNGLVFDKTNQKWIQPPADMAQSQNEFGLNPQYGVDAQGNPVIMQLSKNGTATQAKLPDGIKLSKEPIKLDAGTHFVLLDPITRQQVGIIPKDVAGEKAAETKGKMTAEAVAALPATLQKADQTIAVIDKALQHPGRETATGLSSVFDPRNYIPGTDATNFNEVNKQIAGTAFLQAFESLKGGGAISEVEGLKAQQAIARLSTSQSDEEYKAALLELRSIVEQGKIRAQQMAGQPMSPANSTKPNVDDLLKKYGGQ
jgi:hypothetical protein